MNDELWTTAYKTVTILEAEGLSITQKTLSLWKKKGKVAVNEYGQINVSEVRQKLEAKKNNCSVPKQNKAGKQKKTIIKSHYQTKANFDKEFPEKKVSFKNDNQEDEEGKSSDKQSFAFMKLKGDAIKSKINAKKAKIDYELTRGNLIDREVLNNYVNASISAHNDRILNIPKKLSNLIIAVVRSNKDDAQCRIKLEQKLTDEISTILESEIKEIKKIMKQSKNARA